MNFIKIEVLENKEEGFTSLLLTSRDDTPESREEMDKILQLLLLDKVEKRGGWVPGNSLRVDIKANSPKESS